MIMQWQLILGFLFLLSFPLKAEITTDGSLGPQVNLPGFADQGNRVYLIEPQLGQQQGGNLFHSFYQFNLEAHEIAAFAGTENTRNIISRITGGQSRINGLIDTTGAGEAHLYLLNPAGVLFGPNAQLNVGGEVYVSTADELEFEDGQKFHTQTTDKPVLTMAEPKAFGFLTETPASIGIIGSFLQGQRFSFVGGDLFLEDATLYAPGGRIDLIATASPGTVTFIKSQTSETASPDTVTFTETGIALQKFQKLGNISITQNNFLQRYYAEYSPFERSTLGNLDVSQPTILPEEKAPGAPPSVGGNIFIRGGNLVIESGNILAHNGQNNRIDIQLTDSLSLTQSSAIEADNKSDSNGGGIFIKADKIIVNAMHPEAVEFSKMIDDPEGLIYRKAVQGESFSAAEFEHYLENLPLSPEVKNEIILSAYAEIMQTIQMREGEYVVQEILIDDNISPQEVIQALSDNPLAPLSPQQIEMALRNYAPSSPEDLINFYFQMLETAQQQQLSQDAAHLLADNRITFKEIETLLASKSFTEERISKVLEIEMTPMGIAMLYDFPDLNVITTNADGKGIEQGGSIEITAKEITLNDTNIQTGTSSTGNAGTVSIQADSLHLQQNAFINTSTIQLGEIVDNYGDSGNITLTVDDELTINNASAIGVNSFTNGDAGNLTITTKDLKVNNQSLISSFNEGRGNAGDIEIEVDNLDLIDSSILTAAIEGEGGDITLEEIERLFILNSLLVTRSLQEDAGDLYFSSNFIISKADILASSISGHGGDITINADQYLPSSESVIDNTSKFGIGGKLLVNAPELDMVQFEPKLPSDIQLETEFVNSNCQETDLSLDILGQDVLFK